MAHLDESWLDDAGHLERCDSRGSLRALATAGAQVREALTLAREAGIDDVAGYERPRSVLVGALGGSERVGDVLQTLAQPSSPVPVMTRRDVPLPGWVGPLDLVIAVLGYRQRLGRGLVDDAAGELHVQMDRVELRLATSETAIAELPLVPVAVPAIGHIVM